MDLGLANKVALVTASSKGLGRATAEAIAAEGASVVICARGEEALRAAEESISSSGGEVTSVVADVAEPDAPQRLVDLAVETYGGLDVLVGNAGGPPLGRALEVDDEALLGALNANLLTSVRLVRAAVPKMRERGGGRICLVTSYGIKQPIPGLALSNTARTGLWAWAKTAAQDLVDEGITLNLVCPGLHRTERALQVRGETASDERMGDPADFGRIVTFLCSEQAGYISGAALQVDGAATIGLL